MSLCGSRSSAGSSGRSSSQGNPHTRCALRQGLPTPHREEQMEISNFGCKPYLRDWRCKMSGTKESRESFIFISKLAIAGIFFFF